MAMVLVPDVPMSIPKSTRMVQFLSRSWLLEMKKNRTKRQTWEETATPPSCFQPTHQPTTLTRTASVCLAVLGLLPLLGCGDGEAESKPSKPSARQSVTLRIAVVNDTPLAQAIGRLRGEWQDASGDDFATVEVSSTDTADVRGCDLIVFPSRYLGELTCRGQIRPLRPGLLQSKSLRFDDILPLVRRREIVFGVDVMALPLGCPTPLLVSNAEDPPGEWPRLGAVRHDLTGHAAAYALLERAACYASHPSREAVLFDPETMAPRITEPPFVRALQALAVSQPQAGDPAGADPTPDGAQIAWPHKTDAGAPESQDERLAVSPLPGAETTYNAATGEWEPVDTPRRVTLLATSGRLLSVTTNTRNAAAAFRAAEWLAGRDNVRQLLAASDGLAICRESHRRQRDPWFGPEGPQTADFSLATAEALSAASSLTPPRLVGVDRYLDALGEAVRAVLTSGADPADALQKASQQWETITEELGLDPQRRAYRADLGQPLLLDRS